ncbi:hypothetical protein [Deinococcus aquaedulcis]|uniref:hypothetical protein n=1 Tax=Deinococcus aquaedulcis TaxID=2840455 RepID=UPI001C8305DA|nr:hypothetical protein [Deinococcus aquaedulcis]
MNRAARIGALLALILVVCGVVIVLDQRGATAGSPPAGPAATPATSAPATPQDPGGYGGLK